MLTEKSYVKVVSMHSQESFKGSKETKIIPTKIKLENWSLILTLFSTFYHKLQPIRNRFKLPFKVIVSALIMTRGP